MTNAKRIIAELTAELADLQAKRNEIDLDVPSQVLDELKNRLARHSGSEREENDLRIALSAAENAIRAARNRATELDDQMLPLKAMLTGHDRAQLAQLDADQTEAQLAAAADAVTSAKSTLANLAGLIAEATADRAEDVATAARAVLDAAKAGRVPKPAVVDRGKLDALEAAHALAITELADAEAAHAAAEEDDRDAQAQLQVAQRDAARLDLEIGLRTLAPVVARYRKLSGRDWWPTDDLRRHVYAAERDVFRVE